MTNRDSLDACVSVSGCFVHAQPPAIFIIFCLNLSHALIAIDLDVSHI